jgi:hypothetical protein
MEIGTKRSHGSGDIGNVSHVCPTINPYFDISDGEPCPGHTNEKAFLSISDYALGQAHKAALLLAITAFKCMKDPALYTEIKNEFEKSRIL